MFARHGPLRAEAGSASPRATMKAGDARDAPPSLAAARRDFDRDMATLVEMGFDPVRSRTALVEASGDVQGAAEALATLHVHDRDDDPDAPRSAREAPPRPPPEHREACDPAPPPRTPRLLLPPPGFSAPPRHHPHHRRRADVPPPHERTPPPAWSPPPEEHTARAESATTGAHHQRRLAAEAASVPRAASPPRRAQRRDHPGDGRPRTLPPSPPGARASVVVGRAASGPPPHANAPSSAYSSSSRGAHNTARPPFYRAYEHWASRVGTAACRYLLARGACPHGDDCTFRHGARDARFNPDFRDARFDRTREGWDDRKHCVFFAKGMCRNGDACEWSHEGAVDRSNRRRVPDGGGGGGSSANGNGNGNGDGARRSEDVRSEGTTPNTRDAASDAARLIPGATFVDDDGPPRRRAASSRRRARAGERRAGGVRGNPRDEKNKAEAEAEAEANAAASSSSSSFADADRFEGLFDGVVVDERAAHDRASPSEASGRIAFNRYAAMSRGEPPVRRGFAVADLFASDEGPIRSATPTALNTLSALSPLSTPPPPPPPPVRAAIVAAVCAEEECAVCLDAARSCALLPCGHDDLCRGCAEEEFARQAARGDEDATCPMCRAVVARVVPRGG